MKQFNGKVFKRILTKGGWEAYKKTIPPLTQEQKDIIVGTLLGDATFGGLRDQRPFYGLEYTHKEEHFGYIYHLFEIFKDYVGTGPSKVKVKTAQTIKYKFKFRTCRHDCFIHYHKLFNHRISGVLLKSGEVGDKLVKIVPKAISKYLTPRALAYWFMDDATRTGGTTKVGTYDFCTDAFTYEELQILQQALNDNFGVKVSIMKYHGRYHRLHLLAESLETFLQIVEPFVISKAELECMHYKITQLRALQASKAESKACPLPSPPLKERGVRSQ